MTALERAIRCALMAAVLTLAAPAIGHAAGREYKVLVFTRAVGEQHASTAAGVKAIKDLGKEGPFIVNATADPTEFRADRLKQFRAVVFLNTSGDVLTDAQQAAFEDYYRDGGGFVGIHSAIDTEPDWAFLTDVLGTRATGAPAVAQATVKVADRVHVASKSLPEYWQRTDEWYDFAANVRGRSHVLATVDETTYSGGTMGFDHPVAWCKDFRGGRSFYTARRPHRRRLRRARLPPPPGRRHRVGGRRGRPGLQRLRRHRARQLRADQDQRAAEPQRADRLRPAPRRAHPADRPRRPAAPARPARRTPRRSSRRCPCTPTARTGSTGRRSTTTSPATAGCTSSTRR